MVDGTSNDRLKALLEKMAAAWGSPIVARSKIGEFTGGWVSPGYMANLDSAKKGPPGRLRFGRKIGYQVQPLLAWLLSRMVEVPGEAEKKEVDDAID